MHPFVAFYLFFFLILLPLVLLMIYPIYKKHYETTANVTNFNGDMSKFVYRIELTREQILERLKIPNINDGMHYELKDDEITFSNYGDADSTWQIIIEEYQGFSILRINKLGFILSSQSYIPMIMNPFWANKCDAKPIPFSDSRGRLPLR